MKLRIKNIVVITLMRELYGTMQIIPGQPPRPLTKGVLNYELSGVTRKRLNRLGARLREENEVIEKTKLELLQKYGKKVGDNWQAIVPDEKTGAYKSAAEEKKAKAFLSEMDKIMNDTIEIEVDLLEDRDLPTTTENYECVFSYLTVNSPLAIDEKKKKG